MKFKLFAEVLEGAHHFSQDDSLHLVGNFSAFMMPTVRIERIAVQINKNVSLIPCCDPRIFNHKIFFVFYRNSFPLVIQT